MARALLRRALSLSAAGAHATPWFAAAFASSSAVVPLRSPLDERLHRLLRSEISYIADRRPPYAVRNTLTPPFRSHKSPSRPQQGPHTCFSFPPLPPAAAE